MEGMGAYGGVFAVRMILDQNEALAREAALERAVRAGRRARSDRSGLARRVARAIAGVLRPASSGRGRPVAA